MALINANSTKPSWVDVETNASENFSGNFGVNYENLGSLGNLENLENFGNLESLEKLDFLNFDGSNEANDVCHLPDLTTWYSYNDHHFYIALTLSVAGLCGHTMLIAMLTSRPLFNPINQLLTCLSIMQSILLFSYSTFTVWQRLADTNCVAGFWTWPLATFALVMHGTQTFAQTATQWLIVTISIIRCMSITRFVKTQKPWFTHPVATSCIVVVVVVTFVVCLPVSLWATVKPDTMGEMRAHCIPAHWLNRSLTTSVQLDGIKELFSGSYAIKPTELGNNLRYMAMANSVFLLGGKLLPLIIIMVVSIILLYQLKRMQKRALRMHDRPQDISVNAHLLQQPITNNCSINVSESGGQININWQTHAKRRRSAVRPYRITTNLIMIIILLFIVFEAPQTLVLVYVEFIFGGFITVVRCQKNIVEIFELCSILYSSINLALFCASSAQFRIAFWALIKSGVCSKSQQVRDEITAQHIVDKSSFAVRKLTESPPKPLHNRSMSCRPEFRCPNSSHSLGNGTLSPPQVCRKELTLQPRSASFETKPIEAERHSSAPSPSTAIPQLQTEVIASWYSSYDVSVSIKPLQLNMIESVV